MLIKQNMKFFLSFVKPYSKKILVILFLEIVKILSSVTIPYFLGKMIDSLEKNYATVKLLTIYFSLSIVLYFVWDTSEIIINVKFSIVNKGIQNNIRKFCYKNIFNSKINVLQNKSEGEIITKVIRDTEKLEKAFSNFFYLIISIIHILALFFVMFRINVILTLIILVFFIIVALIQKISSNSLNKLYSKYKKSEETLLTDFKNFISGFMCIKIFSLQDKCIDLLNKRNKTTWKNYIGVNTKIGLVKNMNFFIISAFRVAVLFVGGILYILKQISIGPIFTMYSYSFQLSTQLKEIIEIDIILKDIVISFNRVVNFLSEFQNNNHSTHKISNINEIEFKNTNFMQNNKVIFSNLNLKAKRNDVIAIKGSNGSGKTTLTHIICGFYDVNDYYINGIKQSQFSEDEILKRVSCVPQNIYLFPVTIMENISCFGRVSEEKVYEICKDLGIHEKIMSLSNGYNTLVNEKNVNLSGGEKQIICIARALLKDFDVLILDEIDSALDKTMEETIIKNLRKYFNNKIVFIISHKENILKLCNIEIKVSR